MSKKKTGSGKTGEASQALPPDYVVGIGASAGGLLALETLMPRLPAHRNVAYIVIQHLSPTYESRLDTILSRCTTMPVEFIGERTPLLGGRVYVGRSRTTVRFEEGHIHAYPQSEDQSPGKPINDVFAQIADTFGDQAVGMVLSGTGNDGSDGLVHIRQVGGICLAQDPDTAKFDGMPRNAIATGTVTIIESCECLGTALERYFKDGKLEAGPLLEETQAEDAETSDLHDIYGRIQQAFGLDLNDYKPATVLRRIQRRMTMSQISNVGDYASLIEGNEGELGRLFDDLLVGVTSFFRDHNAFESLYENVITRQIAELPEDGEYRCWVEACSTGEEAYSIGMLILKAIEAQGKKIRAKVFATDINKKAIAFAADGLYPVDAVSQLAEPLRKRYFVDQGNGLFRVAADLRQMLVFYPHNLFINQPFTRIHLVTCRNMLIHLNEKAQQLVIKKFMYALVEGGTLMLGTGESIGGYDEFFEPVDRKWRIYRKPLVSQRLARMPAIAPARPASPLRTHSTQGGLSLRMYDLLVEKLVEHGMLVDGEGIILHLFGDMDDFIKVPAGRPVLDIQSLLSGEARTAVATGLAQARLARIPTRCHNIPCQCRDELCVLDLHIEPILDKLTSNMWFLVEFRVQRREPTDSTQTLALSHDADARIQFLEQELQVARDSLSATLEELNTANEQLQASNEELLASNEQLQNTNEELHSINEELHSVNVENEHKIRELNTLSADLNNMMLASNVGIVFLDEVGAVRMYTAEATKVFNLLPQDVGRNIRHITSLAIEDHIAVEIEDVQTSASVSSRRITTTTGATFLRKISPYFDTNGQSAGVVIALFEVTELIQAQIRLAVAKQASKAKAEFVANVSHELRTPLNVVLGLAQLLRDERLTKRAQSYVDELLVAGEGLLSVINDILDFEKADAGKMELDIYRFSLGDLLSTAETYLSSLCVQKGVSYQVFNNLKYPERVYVGDAGKIQRVLINLIGNAVKFTDKGKVQLSINEGPLEGAVQWLSFDVEDTGVGIPRDKLETIFKPFAQVDGSLPRRFGGTGLGLSICKSIVSLMGGKIHVTSEAGKGSLFVVTLPMEYEQVGGEDTSVRPFAPSRKISGNTNRAKAELPAELAGKTVMIVDDHEPNRNFMRRIFERTGMNVLEAENGEVCVQLVQHGQKADIILMDIQMPVMGGLEATRIVRTLLGDSAPPIVAVTAGVLSSERREALEAGVADFVTKPIDARQTIQLVANLICPQDTPTP